MKAAGVRMLEMTTSPRVEGEVRRMPRILSPFPCGVEGASKTIFGVASLDATRNPAGRARPGGGGLPRSRPGVGGAPLLRGRLAEPEGAAGRRAGHQAGGAARRGAQRIRGVP